ncbi:MAG: hypothetical protein N3A69_06135 [Leptospiraceae bacterium]|nr:hypothetical protein [Leptospiraceae bacterium]
MKEISQFSNFLPNLDERVYYRSHGSLESSAASFSVLHVIAHELRHLAEFRAKAVREGAEIRNEDIDIHYEIRNGRLVAVGGVTRVTTAKKAKETSSENSLSFENGIQDIVEISLKNKTKEELLQKLNEVESDLNLFLVKNLFQQEPNELDATKDERKIQGFERLKEAIKERLRELNEEKNPS